eukprot:GGOE01026944.1.p1 GENE.GGOE01026944.1~~GGOE01026944.1.p1  ORF type:complete len:137 (-),score=3.86 GGOE01026944.1:3-413(-)
MGRTSPQSGGVRTTGMRVRQGGGLGGGRGSICLDKKDKTQLVTPAAGVQTSWVAHMGGKIHFMYECLPHEETWKVGGQPNAAYGIAAPLPQCRASFLPARLKEENGGARKLRPFAHITQWQPEKWMSVLSPASPAN